LAQSRNAPQFPSLESFPQFDQIRGMLEEVAKVPKLVGSNVEIANFNLQGTILLNDGWSLVNPNDPAPYVNLLSGLGDGDMKVWSAVFSHNFDDAFYAGFLQTFAGNREGVFSRRGLWFNVGNMNQDLLDKLKKIDGNSVIEYAQDTFADWLYGELKSEKPEQIERVNEVINRMEGATDAERIASDKGLTSKEKEGFQYAFSNMEKLIKQDLEQGIKSLNEQDLDKRWKMILSEIQAEGGIAEDGFNPSRGRRSYAFGQ